MPVRSSQTPGGKGIQLQGWKPISNQANQCQNVDRLMGAVMNLTSFCLFCHSIVIFIVQPFHLTAISQYHDFLRAICYNWLLIYLAQPVSDPVRPVAPLGLDQMRFRWKRAGKTRVSSAVAWIIFSLKGYSPPVWHVALHLPPHSADIGSQGHGTYGSFPNQPRSERTLTLMHELKYRNVECGAKVSSMCLLTPDLRFQSR